VAAANDAAAVNQYRADWDSAFARAGLRFRDSRLHELVGHVSFYVRDVPNTGRETIASISTSGF
jgi:hypothetical protein